MIDIHYAEVRFERVGGGGDLSPNDVLFKSII